MPTKQIPERLPIEDSFSGALLNIENTVLLATSADIDHATEQSVTLVKQGDFIIRYGIPLLGKPHLSVVPGLLALDYGEILNGEEAFNFILRKSNLYPRADVIGYRNDGVDEMLALKWLDLALPLSVLVYDDPTQIVPLAQIESVIAPADHPLPQHLRDYTTQYETIAAWRQEQINS